MPLEGLRAWIGEVERKLGMRTRVFLVLVVIAVGGAGAAIYLAIDARESSVSESDVQALQEKLEAQIGAGAEGVAKPEPAPEEPTPDTGTTGATGGTGKTSADAIEKAIESGATNGASAPSAADKAKLRELVEQAKAQQAQTEKDQAEK
jgi:hypothetical protein